MLPIINNRKLRIGIVGCGRISAKHFEAVKAHNNDLDLKAVCDIEPATLKKATETYKVPGYSSLSAMLETEQLDLISLCTPSGLHPEQTIAAAKAGVNVVSEKPMATRWSDGLNMVKACDDANVRLFIVKQNRLNTTLQLLKKAISEKRFGKIHTVHINVFWTRPQEYYDRAKWCGTWEFDGGALMNQASHYIDLMEWLIGPVSDIQCMTSTYRDIEVEDTGVMNVRWRNGALGSMAVTMCTYPKNLEGSITILGETGTVRIGGVAVNEIQQWDFSDQKPYDQEIQNANYQTTSVYGFGHPVYYKNVIDTMRGETSAETDGREGLKSLELLIGAYLSARDGKTVSLPLEY
ncbi:Gfo/Idh/MocA family protein [Spongorhabdus nitratireducens]